jgi:hypothetical protein
MKQRVYLDTSVIGGCYDPEFAAFTIPLFDRIKKGEFIFLYSTVTQDELENAPLKVKELVRHLNTDCTELLGPSDDAVALANEYIAETDQGL